MLIFIFSLTLLIAYKVYKITGREQYMTFEKPLRKKLIYWGSVFFISIIFNVLLYSYNRTTYKLSDYINNDNLQLIIFFALCCLIIQLLSPSLFGGIVSEIINRFIKKIAYKKSQEEDTIEQKNKNYSEPSPGKISSIYSAEKLKASLEDFKDLQERDFEHFLNTMCWLAFAFVIFITGILEIINYGASHNVFTVISTEYETAREQLNYIGSLMLIFTLPIALRQILFYLDRLRKSKSCRDENLGINSIKYQKYMLIQKRLVKANKRL